MRRQSRVTGELLFVIAIAACDGRERAETSQPRVDAGTDVIDSGASDTSPSNTIDTRSDFADIAIAVPQDASTSEEPCRSQTPDANVGDLCGSCGGQILCDGTCSVVTPANLGLACGCGGKVLCDRSCSQPDNTCIPTGEWYVLTNMFLGNDRRLDTYAGPPGDAFMSQPGPMTSGQYWKITAVGGGYYRLTNMFGGDAVSLQPAGDGNKLSMSPNNNDPAAQWKVTAAFGDYFSLTNMLFGARRLDTMNTAAGEPWLAPTADASGQYWKITKVQ